MTLPTPQCMYCAIDILDKDKTNHNYAECGECRTAYHLDCYREKNACVKCSSALISLSSIDSVAILKPSANNSELSDLVTAGTKPITWKMVQQAHGWNVPECLQETYSQYVHEYKHIFETSSKIISGSQDKIYPVDSIFPGLVFGTAGAFISGCCIDPIYHSALLDFLAAGASLSIGMLANRVIYFALSPEEKLLLPIHHEQIKLEKKRREKKIRQLHEEYAKKLLP